MARHQNAEIFGFEIATRRIRLFHKFESVIWLDFTRNIIINWGRVCGTLQKKIVIGEHQNPRFQKMVTGTARRQQDVGIGRVIFEKIAARMISCAEMPTPAQGSQGKEVCEQDVTYKY